MPAEGTRPDAARRWTALYSRGVTGSLQLEYSDTVEAWRARVGRAPRSIAIRYFDAVLKTAAVDAHSDALAVELQDRGVIAGDRIGIHLQNIPHYPIALLAIWKAGGIAVPLNPMYQGRELRKLVDDCGAVGVIVARGTEEDTRATLGGGTVRWLLSASARDFQSRNDPRAFQEPMSDLRATGVEDLGAVLVRRAGQRPSEVPGTPETPAFLTYTSGTTGPPKGALNTHLNYLHAVANYAQWTGVGPEDVVFAIAPLFHITGLSLNAGIALFTDATLSMAGRFEPAIALDAFAEHGVTTTIGSITAFNALLRVPAASAAHMPAVRLLYSGGAPIPPATIEAFHARFGQYLHNVWGMTETSGGGIAVPSGARAPVHEPSGTLSIGVPMQNAEARIIDHDGAPVPAGAEGELVFSAPQVVPGYWDNQAATEHTFPGGRLHTGDVAVMDEAGWIYLVDRKKDQINTSGYKVWPREVEDVLYEHPAVFEAAVIGAPDDYRGETVVAYVSLRDGAAVDIDELIAFAGERLAAYKRPREVHILPELPKTATGKIQRARIRAGRTT